MFIDTLFPQALYSFATFVAVVLFMPMCGNWIDTGDRIKVVTKTICVQNVCVIISCIGMVFISALHKDNINNKQSVPLDWSLMIIFGTLILTSMIGEVMGVGVTLALEKDWIVALSQNDNKQLTLLNSRLRRVDLCCKLLAPASFGILSQYTDKITGNDSPVMKIQFGNAVVCIYNIISLIFEYASVKCLYSANLDLWFRTDDDDDNSNSNGKHESPFSNLYNGWKDYISSNMLFASVAYCMLYMSVLDGGILVTAYLKFCNISDLVLGMCYSMNNYKFLLLTLSWFHF